MAAKKKKKKKKNLSEKQFQYRKQFTLKDAFALQTFAPIVVLCEKTKTLPH
jgi:hypothetical protein